MSKMREFKIRPSKSGLFSTNGKDALGLGVGVTTYLKKWYAEETYCDYENITSKYLQKGLICEDKALEMVSEKLDIFLPNAKNIDKFENEFCIGTPDLIVNDMVIDTKCSWDSKTFLEAVTSEINTDYYYQLQCYMWLTGLKKAKLVYVLLDTPAECNYGQEVTYSHLPLEQRYFDIDIEFDETLIERIKAKVESCREFLNDYDKLIKSKLHGNNF